jgi:hypothetical protein
VVVWREVEEEEAGKDEVMRASMSQQAGNFREGTSPTHCPALPCLALAGSYVGVMRGKLQVPAL